MNKTKYEYKVITELSYAENEFMAIIFNKELNKHIKDGWSIKGNLNTVVFRPCVVYSILLERGLPQRGQDNER